MAGRRMRIRAGDVEVFATLYDTPTSDVVWLLLPLSGRATRWGDEFYFRLPEMMADLEDDARDVLDVGEVGYWVQGQAVAVLFGRTPASRDGEPRTVTPVNVFAKIEDEARAFDRLADGVTFTLERVE